MYIMYAMYRVPSDPWSAAQGEDMITVYDQWMGSTSYTDEQKFEVLKKRLDAKRIRGVIDVTRSLEERKGKKEG